ncbi:uncharacterized protein LOC116248821 [Nymphaea colorata]|nr:uncharacterized protein LOC116248821 [Nymphaea colorata]
MSRCFPYPPPGFLKSNSGGAVYEVLKEKQKDKKERKKERKHKGDSEHGMDKEKKHDKRRRHKHERKEKLKDEDHVGRIKEETEQIEKSCLTEEHGQPVGTQNSPDSLDSVGYRGKRPLDSSSCPCEPPSHKKQRTTCDAIGTHGKGLWIRLPILKNSERQQSSKQACSSSSTPVTPAQVLETSSFIQQNAEIAAQSTESQCKGSTSFRLELQDGKAVGHSFEAQIEERAGDYYPPLPQMPSELIEPDDLEWLFGGGGQGAARTCEAQREIGYGAVWSQACYLPSAEMHALPYVIPY